MRKRIYICLACASFLAVSLAQADDPAITGLAALAQSKYDGPIVVMDLVKFKPGGEAEYNEYDAIAEAKVRSLGGEVVFRGKAKQIEGLGEPKWDRVTFRKYPTPQAVVAMGSSPEYQGAFPHRLASVSDSFVYAFSGDSPLAPAAETVETVYMLNLLRFKKDGGLDTYFNEYGAAVRPLIESRGGGVVFNLEGVTPVISNERVDRLILVSYPSPESFRGMITSEAYRAVAGKRTDAIELGLLFPFSNTRTK